MKINKGWPKVSNVEVVVKWSRNKPARSWTENLYTDGKEIYSYELQIGDTTDDDKKIVRDYTARGSYGFRSQTTSCHVGLLRCIRDREIIVV